MMSGNRRVPIVKQYIHAALTLCFFVAVLPTQAQGLPGQPGVHLVFPAESPGIPAYVRINLNVDEFDVPNDGKWAALVFYRDPGCIPLDFDLGLFFDPPGPGGLGAFNCPILTEGLELWENGPGTDDVAPIYVRSRNATPGLPVWFVAWSEIQPILDTGHVFIGEIVALPSLIRGSARWFEEALYPGGAAADPSITIRAEGRLETGGRFSLNWHNQSSTGEDDIAIHLELLPLRPGRRGNRSP
jgi:hypothetical protein